jgi:hypothetical protein
VIRYPTCDLYGRQLLSIAIGSLNALPSDLGLSKGHFTCLLACDAGDSSEEEITEAVDSLLVQGLSYLCAWGPGCERIHLIADLGIVHRQIKDGKEYPVLTTSHEGKHLSEALWFLLNVAYPDDAYAETCTYSLVVSVGNPNWDAEVAYWLADPEGLT